MSADGTEGRATAFFALTPERVLDAVEAGGMRTTGSCQALNSLENRVYEVEIEDDDGRRDRLVAKFYRPGRWSRAVIADEHALLEALVEDEVAVCAPRRMVTAARVDSIQETVDGILYSLFPRIGGRPLEDLTAEDYTSLGSLVARVHNTAARLSLRHRPALDPASYGRAGLDTIVDRAPVGSALRARLAEVGTALLGAIGRAWPSAPTQVVHADCHRGNILRRGPSFVLLDFDDSARAPAIQDVWLLLPGRVSDSAPELDAFVTGYERFRLFPHHELHLVEPLRALRYLRYAAWILARYEDPSFQRTFPQAAGEGYWEGLLGDLTEQLARIVGD